MSGETILVVEDEGLIALDLRKKLEQAGYTVPMVADNADDEVARLRTLCRLIPLRFAHMPSHGILVGEVLAGKRLIDENWHGSRLRLRLRLGGRCWAIGCGSFLCRGHHRVRCLCRGKVGESEYAAG